MTRWILLTEFFPPEEGGIQRALVTLVSNAGREVTVVTRPVPGADDFDRRQPYEILRKSLFSGRLKPRWLWLAGWLWPRRNQRVVFGHLSAAVAAAWLLRPFGLRYAILVHGQDILSEAHRPGRRWLVARLLRSADWVGVNSSYTGHIVAGFGVASGLIVRTHPAIPDERIQPPTPRTGLALLTVCRLVPRKNVATLIEAVARLKPDYPDLTLDILGDGPDRSRLERLARERGVETEVTFHGRVTEELKNKKLAAARVFIMTPRVLADGTDVEGLGVVYLEAAAAGLPIIASGTGGVTDIVTHGQTGRLVNPESVEEIAAAIRQLMQDEQATRHFVEAAQSRLRQEFTASVRNERFRIQMNQGVRPPKISVVIPVHNHAVTIAQTLQCVIRQTWPASEIIVVDDGSTDRLGDALAPYRSSLRLISQSQRGAPHARNVGAEVATGEFLIFLDADMWLDKRMLERMATALMTHPEASFVYSRFRFGPKGFRLHEFSVEKLRRRNYIHTSSLIRRVDFPGFDQNLRRFQDWDLWLTLSEAGKAGIFIPAELFRVSQGRGGMRASRWQPRILYRLPLLGRGLGNKNIRDYRAAEQVIRAKHGLGDDLSGR